MSAATSSFVHSRRGTTWTRWRCNTTPSSFRGGEVDVEEEQAMLVIFLLASLASSIPAADINKICASAQVDALPEDRAKALRGCVGDETSARDQIKREWNRFTAADRSMNSEGFFHGRDVRRAKPRLRIVDRKTAGIGGGGFGGYSRRDVGREFPDYRRPR